jgi:hypothetical protein
MTYFINISLFPLSWLSSPVYTVSLPTLRHGTSQWSTDDCGRFLYHVSAFSTLCNLCSWNGNAKQHTNYWVRNFKIIALLNVTPCSLMGSCQCYGRILCHHRLGFFWPLITTYQNARRPFPQNNSHTFRSLRNIKCHTRILQFTAYINIRPEYIETRNLISTIRCHRYRMVCEQCWR